jgi:hypothetical protein
MTAVLDALDAIPAASWQRLNALGSVTPCSVCDELSLDGIHPNCAEPSTWPAKLLDPSPAERLMHRRCLTCHGKGWVAPNDTRPACPDCKGTGTLPWRTR